MKTQTGDKVIDELRKVRHSISSEYQHDPHRLIQHLIELQQEYADRLIFAANDPTSGFTTHLRVESKSDSGGSQSGSTDEKR